MTTDELAAESRSHGPSRRAFIRHFLEMVAAMVVGMAVLGIAVRLVLVLFGSASLLDGTEAGILVMATNMAIGMSVWMRYRGHGWASIAEMAVAMVASFVILIIPFRAGVLPEGAVMMVGHVVMLPVMALVMLRRRQEYVTADRHCQ